MSETLENFHTNLLVIDELCQFSSIQSGIVTIKEVVVTIFVNIEVA